ncbi:MAG: ABC transporter ATP-binding protein [Planctomycetota bacterium]|jgi:NitT/TauT family transport system ATP-binding protein|nr:ABC transporter ATP-binding protein [Planctomycetota bacterium]
MPLHDNAFAAPGCIAVEDVSFSYGGGERVLDRIDLAIDRGEFVAVIGPSGCGKSTLLRLLAGLAGPDSGRLSVSGVPVTGPGLDRAVVFQDYSLFPWMSCRDNIVLALEQAGMGAAREERRAIASDYLELVGLRADGGKLPGELSGGMRQRTAIARALAVNAPILLMDEPFGALDEITRARQQDLLLNLWQDGRAGGGGKTVLFVTHDVEEAVILGDRVIVMGTRPGRIVRDFPVGLPRPRSRNSAIHHDDFVAVRDKLLRDLNLVVDERLGPAGLAGQGDGI